MDELCDGTPKYIFWGTKNRMVPHFLKREVPNAFAMENKQVYSCALRWNCFYI